MRRFAVLSLILVLLFACRQKATTPPDVIVRAGDRMLTLADFKRYLDRNTGTELAQMSHEVASAVLDQYVEEVLLAEHAAASGIVVPADAIAAAVRNDAGSTVIEKRDEMLRQRLVASVAADVEEPSETAVAEYYRAHQNDFRTDDQVRVRQILLSDEALANQVAARAAKGEPFEDLASQYSRAPNAKRGGEIGYVSRGELPKLFEEEIFALQPGGITSVMQTDKSFHLFKVEDRRKAGVLDLASAAPVIRDRLREDALRDRIAQLVNRSRRQLKVAVLPRRLPFRYSGSLPAVPDE